MKKLLTPLLVLLLLGSCSTVAGDLLNSMVETDMQMGWESLSKSSTIKPMDKKVAQEQEQMKKSGKCPLCRGMGKSIDGKYDCSACGGTGKYVEPAPKEGK